MRKPCKDPNSAAGMMAIEILLARTQKAQCNSTACYARETSRQFENPAEHLDLLFSIEDDSKEIKMY